MQAGFSRGINWRYRKRHKGYTRSFECFRNVCTSSQGLTGISDSLPLGTGLSRRSSMARSFRSNTFYNMMPLSSREDFGSPSCPQENGRCLAGLSFEETIEFETLEALPPLDDSGNVGWTFEGEPTTPREKRWLELYRKHERALKPKRR